MRIRSLCLLAFAFWLMACGTAAPTPLPVENQTRPPLPTAAPLPTIYPTYTPFQPQLVPPVTVAAPTAAPTGTPIDFSRPIITLRYAIPALGLERTLQGTLDSTIQLVDLAAGTSIALPNQRRALLELQSVLPSLQLDELPQNCGRCVGFSYELAATGQSGAGWLKDVVLMASVEQFFAINLGPHFPPGTVLGLHRTASPYTVAHTLAITAEGELWHWEATDAEVGDPTTADPALLQLAAELPVGRLESSYSAPCANVPRETLLIGGQTPTSVVINCPALSLPLPLVEVYSQVGELATAALDPLNNFPLPAQRLPLDAVLYFLNEAGDELILYADGRQTLQSAAGGSPITTPITATEVVSLTNSLITSGVIARAVAIAPTTELEVQALLLVRGELGVYEFGWSDNIGRTLLPAVLQLDELIRKP